MAAFWKDRRGPALKPAPNPLGELDDSAPKPREFPDPTPKVGCVEPKAGPEDEILTLLIPDEPKPGDPKPLEPKLADPKLVEPNGVVEPDPNAPPNPDEAPPPNVGTPNADPLELEVLSVPKDDVAPNAEEPR
jgi:hypothetical protein